MSSGGNNNSTSQKKQLLEEPLPVPSNHKDSSSITMRTFDANFRTLNGGLMSLGKNIGILHGKVQTFENTNKDISDIKQRLSNLEERQLSNTKLLNDIYDLLKRATQDDSDDIVNVERTTDVLTDNVIVNNDITDNNDKLKDTVLVDKVEDGLADKVDNTDKVEDELVEKQSEPADKLPSTNYITNITNTDIVDNVNVTTDTDKTPSDEIEIELDDDIVIDTESDPVKNFTHKVTIEHTNVNTSVESDNLSNNNVESDNLSNNNTKAVKSTTKDKKKTKSTDNTAAKKKTSSKPKKR